ncbi:hypothetical protein QE152_g766 [Popillia japonica]|uniref:Glutamate--cysteine ligase modifier subunit n=1 Tax=Popillia japonica TaxID=7064 RepID=A0AAW1N581_POPJA
MLNVAAAVILYNFQEGFRRSRSTFRYSVNFRYLKMENMLNNSKTLLINTGNILALNDLTKNPGQNPAEELKEAINITLKDFKNGPLEKTNFKPDPFLVVSRQHDDLVSKIDNEQYLIEALDKAFTVLNVSSVQNVIVSYNHQIPQNDHIGKLQNIWKVLELYTKNKKIGQIGLADLEEATCCVVPPTLQAFCKDNEVQLLTHSDPTEILPESTIEQIFEKKLILNWALRFLVHIKCRGVLTTKGYLISLNH